MVIEILSPSTAYYDLRHEKEIYAMHGVKEYWIVDPIEKSIEVYESKNSELVQIGRDIKAGRISSSVIPGCEFELDAVF